MITSMPSYLRRPLAMAAATLLVFAWTLVPAGAEDPSQETSSIEETIRQYLMEHPEVIIESLRAYDARQREAEAEQVRQTLEDRHDELFSSPHSPVIGDPEAEVVFVEFTDYRCPYCKRFSKVLREVMKDVSDFAMVVKEYPILSQESVEAARAALAAARQGKYEAFHFALMESPGDLSRKHLLSVARSVGLDTETLAKDMRAPEVTAELRRNIVLGEVLGIDGTPAVVVGEEIINGAPDRAQFERLIEEARAEAPS